MHACSTNINSFVCLIKHFRYCWCFLIRDLYSISQFCKIIKNCKNKAQRPLEKSGLWSKCQCDTMGQQQQRDAALVFLQSSCNACADIYHKILSNYYNVLCITFGYFKINIHAIFEIMTQWTCQLLNCFHNSVPHKLLGYIVPLFPICPAVGSIRQASTILFCSISREEK